MTKWYKINNTKIIDVESICVCIYNKKEEFIEVLYKHGEYSKLYHIREDEYQALAKHLENLHITAEQISLLRDLKNELTQSNAVLEAINQILDGGEPSDFMLSFPMVRKVWDLKQKGETL